MNIKSAIYKSKIIPKRILVKKILKKIFGGSIKNQRIFDQTNETYLEYPYDNIEVSNFLNLDLSKINDIDKDSLIDQTNRIIDHEFKILNDSYVESKYHNKSDLTNQLNAEYSIFFADKIIGDYKKLDWHSDFNASYSWDKNTWFKDIKYGDREGVDVKVPWEFGRMQHLPLLALSYAITKEEKYLIEWQNQIYDFYSQNPPRFGVQWSSSMDVAIRAVNLLVSFDILDQTGSIDSTFQKDFIEIIYNHSVHLHNNLEWNDGMRGNHYLANITGLIFIAAYFPKTDETDKWMEFASSELINEINYQFNDDGSNFEASTAYHNLSTQFVLHSYAILISSGINIDDQMKRKLEKIVYFSLSIAGLTGLLPQIGDNDSGFLFSFLPNNNPLSIDWMNDLINISNSNSIVSYKDKIELESLKTNSHIHFDDFGIVNNEREKYQIVVRCGDVGQNGKGGHSHNDQLSFVLIVNGSEIITDPGTYLYTSSTENRNLFRSTEYHNTLSIDGQEQNEWFIDSIDDLFWIKEDKAQGSIIHSDENEFVGKHSGFYKAHLRTIKYLDNGFEIIDECQIDSKKYLSFHFHPNCEIDVKADIVYIKLSDSEIKIRFDSGKIFIEDYDFSPSYGIKLPAKKIKVYFVETQIKTKIEIK